MRLPDEATARGQAGALRSGLRLAQSILGLLVIFSLAVLVSPRGPDGWPIFLNLSNLTNLVRQMSEIGLIALAMTFVILTAGIDLSVGSVLALAAALTAMLLTDWQPTIAQPLHFTLAIAIAAGACAAVGALNGLAIAFFRIQPFVVTLAAMIGIRGLARWLTDNSNIGLSFGSDHVSGAFADFFSQRALVIGTFLAMAAFLAIILSRTIFGRYVRALGDNPQAALYAGLPVRAIQVAVYTLSGLAAGLAGVIHCAQNRQGNPNDGVAYELDAIAAVVIGGTSLRGGKGSVFGTVVGTLILGVITNILGLLGADENVKWMTKAVIIVGAVLLQQSNALEKLWRITRLNSQHARTGETQP